MTKIHPKMNDWNESRRVFLSDEIVAQMFHGGATIIEIATALGCSTYPVKKVLSRLELRRPAKRRAGKSVGPNNPSWRGGRRVRSDGYVIVWTPYGERLEHRVVIEQYIGRPLSDSEIVHHRDGDKSNNDPENLAVMSQS